jgi:heme/copper-type cytochrome/quinol oxidase subunit 2
MIFRSLLFWLRRPPDTDSDKMTLTTWNNFLEFIAARLVLLVAGLIVLTLIAYVLHARRRRVVYPGDYFRAYTPLRWPPLMALIPSVILFLLYLFEYHRAFPLTAVSPLGGAITVAAAGWIATWGLSRLLVMLPAVTPRVFRYRPIAAFIPKAAAGNGEGNS